jgi:hypothetical protein
VASRAPRPNSIALVSTVTGMIPAIAVIIGPI